MEHSFVPLFNLEKSSVLSL